MRIILKRLTSVCFAITLLTFSFLTASAEGENDNNLTINGQAEVNVGDVVTYTLYLSDATEPIVGFELRLFYDEECLKYQQGSLKFDQFDVVYNEGIPGRIPMNCTQFSTPSDFSKKARFFSVSFEVIKGGEADITYFITELYGENLENLTNYTFTYDLTKGDKALISNQPPIVNQDEENLDRYAGAFPNYEDGMGDNHVNAKGNVQHIQLGTTTGEVIPKAETKSNWFEKYGWLLFLGVGVAITAVISAIVVVSVKSKKDE